MYSDPGPGRRRIIRITNVQTNFLAFHGTVKPITTMGASRYHDVAPSLSLYHPAQNIVVMRQSLMLLLLFKCYCRAPPLDGGTRARTGTAQHIDGGRVNGLPVRRLPHKTETQNGRPPYGHNNDAALTVT